MTEARVQSSRRCSYAACLLIVFGLATGPAVASPPSLKSMVLRLNDVPAGFALDYSRAKSRAQVAAEVATGAGGIWVTTPHPQSAVARPRSAVWRIDPKTNKTGAVIPVPPTAQRVAVGAGFVWVTSGTYHGEPGVPATGGSLSKIDPDANRVIATIKLGFRPDGVVVYDGLVWVAVAPR